MQAPHLCNTLHNSFMPCPASGLGADLATQQQPSHGYTMLTVYYCSLPPAKQDSKKKSSLANRHVLPGTFRRPRVRIRVLGHAALFKTESRTHHGLPLLLLILGNRPAISLQQASRKPATSQQQASSKPASSQHQASSKPAASQHQASSKPASSQQQASSQHRTSSKVLW